MADAVLIVHLGFVLFVMFGGVLVWRWPRAASLHLPALAWGAAVELAGWICPLTPLENALRAHAGDAAYGGDFIAHYLLAVIYPNGLTRGTQIALGVAVLIFNAAVYGARMRVRRDRRV